MVAELPLRLFTVEEFHRLGEAGILDEDSRVELIEGRIVNMAPIGMPHAMCVANVSQLLIEQLGRKALVWAQNPVRFGETTELYPDVALLRPLENSHDVPTGGDVLLIVEVADTTLRSDRKVKVPMYARWGVPEVWIVDLKKGAVEVYNQLEEATYRRVERATKGQALPVPGFPNISLLVEEIVGEGS